MFTAQELRDQMAFALDAENSDHYRDDLDYIPAINAGMKWLVSVVNMALGQNKIGEEFFRELQYSAVFQADTDSRISLSVFPSDVWTILAVYPKPNVKVNKSSPAIIATDTSRSYYRPDRIHLSSDNDAARLSVEEWAKSKQNPFQPGYEGPEICGDLKRYGYLNPINYQGSSLGLHGQEMEVRPDVGGEFVTVFWAKTPDQVTSLADQIQFPTSVFQMLFNKALSYIGYKQGDGTSLYMVTDRDLQLFIAALG